MNMFERAARMKLRFVCGVGILTVEDIFEMPLTVTGNRMSLDRLAREIHAELKNFDEVSFVEDKPNPAKIELELKFEIVKHIIESKKADAKGAETRKQNEQLREKLLEIKAKKTDASLENLSEEEIDKKLAELAPA